MLVLTLLCAHLSFFAVFIISKDLFLLLNLVSTLVLHVSISMQLQLTAEIRRQVSNTLEPRLPRFSGYLINVLN